MLAVIDAPAGQVAVDPLCFLVRGWIWLGLAHEEVVAVEAWAGDTFLGETALLDVRADVVSSLRLAADARAGFELFAHHPAARPGTSFNLHLRGRRRDGTRTHALVTTEVATFARDYREDHFGVLLDQRTTAIQRRENIWATGPSQADGSPDVAALLRARLGPPPLRVIDVGCGIGSYGRSLLADGYAWLGVEIDDHDCAELARLHLPHRHVDGRTLPFADGAFDAALCLEVLEHIDEPVSFLAEVHRVAPRRLIASVPNCELLPYLSAYLATPWHMLEADHKNFFTRWSLGALLRQFYPHVELGFHTLCPLPTVEGTPLHYHLLAVASSLPESTGKK